MIPPVEPEAAAGPRPEDGALWVDLPVFHGPLDRLLIAAQRGEIDVTTVQVAQITGEFRRHLAAGAAAPSLAEVADFLTLAARLLALKANALLPENAAPEEDEGEPEDDAGRRLAEYRLFKAAVDRLLSDGDDGFQSFLGLVAPDVVPVERLRIPPERLVAALRAVVERFSEADPLPLGVVTFSVREMVARLRARLRPGVTLTFDDLFTGVTSRLEAVACFLALLELLNGGEATVEQRQTFGEILVSGRG